MVFPRKKTCYPTGNLQLRRTFFFFVSKFIVVTYFSLCTNHLLAQQQITGTVLDRDTRQPLIGVSISVVGSTIGTITDLEGMYNLEVPEAAMLQFSFVGYEDQQIRVGHQSVVDVELSAGIELGEIVVTSLGMEREKKALNYSVTQLEGNSFQEAREINFANGLAGKVAGVNVSNIASGPAGSTRVIIRGNVSLDGNNQPLYVIDGVPIDNTTFGQASRFGGVDEGDGMASTNPEDIESISILKGANAAALYGSRASNGVVLITTKSGQVGSGIGVSVNSNFVVETLLDHFELQQTYGNGRNGRPPADATQAWGFFSSQWGGRLDGSLVPQSDGVSRPYLHQTTENLRRYYQAGTTWTNSLEFSGGTENHRIRLNLADLRSNSFIPNAGFDRQNVSLSYTGNFADRLHITSKINYSHEFADNRPRISDLPGNGFMGLFTMPASYNIDDFRGDPDKLGSVPQGVTTLDNKIPGEELQLYQVPVHQNPWWTAYQFGNDDTRDRIIGSQLARLNLTKELYLQGRLGIDWYTRRETDLTPFGTGFQRRGSLMENERRVREINLEGIIGFNKRFKSFSLDAFAGGNRMRRSSESLFLLGSDFNIPFFHTFANLANQTPTYRFFEEGINSIFGSATFGVKDFIYLTVTARNDRFSTLNPTTNDILYPSIGGSFILSELLNLPANSLLTFAKLRASWAEVGGDTEPYRLNLTYTLGSGHGDLPNATVEQTSIPNRALRPLTSSEFEVGLDLQMLDNRLGLDFSYYHQMTRDDILNAAVSETSGFGSSVINIGDVSNRGWELLLTSTPVRTQALTWNVDLNLAKNNSEIIRLSNAVRELQVGGNLGESRFLDASIFHIVGQPFGSIVGFTQQMINGQPVFNPNNGQPVRNNQSTIIGNGIHKLSGGINNRLVFGNLSLDFLVDFKMDGDIYSGTNAFLVRTGLHSMTAETWSDLGIEANGRESITVTGVDPSGNPLTKTLEPFEVGGFYTAYNQLSDRFIRDASFIKLRQLSIGYNLPRDLLKKTPLRTARISLVGRNLLLIYHNIENVDPESTYNNSNAQGLDFFGVPQTRTYGFNVRLGF